MNEMKSSRTICCVFQYQNVEKGNQCGRCDDLQNLLDMTSHEPRPFLRSSIVSFSITQHILKNANITFSGNTGTPEMFQYSLILGRSSIWDLKYTFSNPLLPDFWDEGVGMDKVLEQGAPLSGNDKEN